jgi:hypothetical protein
VKADAVSQLSLDPEPPAAPAPKRGGAAARAAGARPGV